MSIQWITLDGTLAQRARFPTMSKKHKSETIKARTHRLEHSRQTLAVMRAENESILMCAKLSRDIDRQEQELAQAVELERAKTPEQRAGEEAARQERIDKYQFMLARARKSREGGDA